MMAIDAWENHTKVVDNEGREGRIKVTRHERMLIDSDKLHYIDVISEGGQRRTYKISDLTEVIKEEPQECCSCCGKCN
ncbi:hypothetical protein KAR91_47865 [Candidatus Pacearchaeota archaeon]|nr:hypothetical protein [Candidatus Pacearchaeota archaeon]